MSGARLSTGRKLQLARAVARPLLAARAAVRLGPVVRVSRGGARWELDLREGIDLGLYLGVFERSTARACRMALRPGATAVDVGANVGAHVLPMARVVGPRGKVVAFEPTAWAFERLTRNLALNPELARVVDAERAFLVARVGDGPPATAHASWPLVGAGSTHPLHGGRRMPATGAGTTTLDDYVAGHGIGRLDLLKIDVDGDEARVLRGAHLTLRELAPLVIIEIAPYVLDEEGSSADEVVTLLGEAGYALRELGSGRPLPMDGGALARVVARGSSMNALATPRGAGSGSER